jgi:hypothetical protein
MQSGDTSDLFGRALPPAPAAAPGAAAAAAVHPSRLALPVLSRCVPLHWLLRAFVALTRVSSECHVWLTNAYTEGTAARALLTGTSAAAAAGTKALAEDYFARAIVPSAAPSPSASPSLLTLIERCAPSLGGAESADSPAAALHYALLRCALQRIHSLHVRWEGWSLLLTADTDKAAEGAAALERVRKELEGMCLCCAASALCLR